MTKVEMRDLPRAAWLWCIPIPLLIQLGAWQLDNEGKFFARWIESEAGLIENATAILLIFATIMSLRVGFKLFKCVESMYSMWFFGVALVCFGFAGEELSWGQHWIGWDSPEYFAENNRQGETNFHNFNIHFGRVVKSILTLAIVIGGLIMPLRHSGDLVRATPIRHFLFFITPTRVCIPAAAFVLGVRLIERLKTWSNLDWNFLAVNLKESQELYIALFLLIYVWSARART